MQIHTEFRIYDRHVASQQVRQELQELHTAIMEMLGRGNQEHIHHQIQGK